MTVKHISYLFRVFISYAFFVPFAVIEGAIRGGRNGFLDIIEHIEFSKSTWRKKNLKETK